MRNYYIIISIFVFFSQVFVYSHVDERKNLVNVSKIVQLDKEMRLSMAEAEKKYADKPALLANLKHSKAKKLFKEYQLNRNIKKLYTALNMAGDAIKLESKQALYWMTLGNIHSEFSKFNILRAHEYAIESFLQVLELDHGNAPAMVQLGIKLASSNEYKKALVYFEKAIKTSILVLSGNLLKWMHISYINGAQTKHGISFYQYILDKHPEYYYLHLSKALLYKAHFDYKNARKELEKLIANNKVDEKTKDKAIDFLILIMKKHHEANN